MRIVSSSLHNRSRHVLTKYSWRQMWIRLGWNSPCLFGHCVLLAARDEESVVPRNRHLVQTPRVSSQMEANRGQHQRRRVENRRVQGGHRRLNREKYIQHCIQRKKFISSCSNGSIRRQQTRTSSSTRKTEFYLPVNCSLQRGYVCWL